MSFYTASERKYMFHKIGNTLILVLLVLSLLITGCSGQGAQPAQSSRDVKLTLAAYTTPREAYGEIIPMFQAYWKNKTGQNVTFEESYLGSGAQSRAVVEGFEADVVALSLEADVIRIQDAGLITHDWKSGPTQGIVSDSVVVFAVRKGNPLGIKDWNDLTTEGIEILTPNPATSGGAMWNLLALYGALMRGQVEGVPADDPAAAHDFVMKFLKNVLVMDKGARESITNFENGVGNVAVTYENEVLVARKGGQDYDMVIPGSSILIQNPVAVVDSYVDKHGTREVAEAFVAYLLTPEVQQVFANYGLRSVDKGVAEATAAQYPPLKDLFTIDYFGGWAKATPEYFGEQGIFTKALIDAQVGTSSQ
jgi:sulfate transport system substrate-binding protein